MKNLTNNTIRSSFLLAMLSSCALLTACGGGAGSSANQSALPTTSTNNIPAATVNNEGFAQKVTVSTNNNTAMVFNTRIQKIEPVSVSQNNDAITVDGLNIDISQRAVIARRIGSHINTDTMAGTVLRSDDSYNNSYTTWGQVWSAEKQATYSFVTGHLTNPADMPTTGTAQYTGSYVFNTYYNSNAGDQASAVAEGSSGVSSQANFTADFSKNTLTGTLSGNYSNTSIEATITGNTFKGDVNGVQSYGGFYGPKAAEIAGGFVDRNANIIGTFGAQKVQ